MAKGSPYLKKATGAPKASVASDRKKRGLGRSIDFGSGVDGLLGASAALPKAVVPSGAPAGRTRLKRLSSSSSSSSSPSEERPVGQLLVWQHPKRASE